MEASHRTDGPGSGAQQQQAGNGKPDATAIVPALIGARLTEEGTELHDDVVLDGWQLGLSLDRKHLVLRSHDRSEASELPKRVTATFLGKAFEDCGIELDDGVLEDFAKKVRKALKSDASFKRASTIKPRKVVWLWKPYLPRRLATMLGGDGGMGKSIASVDWAATVSWGGEFSDGWKSLNGEPADVLIMSAEDAAEEVLVPRLMAAGADLDRVTIRDFNLGDGLVLDDEGIANIERQMAERRPKLIIIDPVVSFMGDKIDMHRSNEVRPMMQKLGALARKYDCAILVIAHFNKDESKKPGNRIGGSVDFRNAVRSLLLVGEVAEDPDRGRAIFHDKVNYAKKGRPLGFDVVDAEPDTARVAWRETDLTLSEVFGGGKLGPSQQKIAEDVIVNCLRIAPDFRADSEAVKSVIRAAIPKANDRTIARARENAHVFVHRNVGGTGRVEWELPELLRFR